MTQRFFFDRAMVGARIAENVQIDVSAAGSIRMVRDGVAWSDAERDGAVRISGVAIPAMHNLHSHAFQRAMAGRAERRSTAGDDNFWTWRTTMYELALKISPEDVHAVAAQAYVEMLKAGYVSVAEFHYLHHAPNGALYKEPNAMADAIIAAADKTEIALTLLPVLYQNANFGGERLLFEQRRFRSTCDEYFGQIDTLKSAFDTPDRRLGVAFHSLRAVDEAAIEEVLSFRTMQDDSAPVHIHIAEQIKEVEDCVKWSGARPIQWLMDHAPVDEDWCLVHMTHASPAEQLQVVRSGAVAGLCPTTEANLGDGMFALQDFVRSGGRIGIGSDSQVSISPVEELRWLEYSQRLIRRERAVTTSPDAPSPGLSLWAAAAAGGGQACGRQTGILEGGSRADLVILDDQHPSLYGASDDDVVDAFLFSGTREALRDVMIGGRWVIRNRRHPREEEIEEQFRKAMDRLAAD